MIISVINLKGGVGKTTTAIALATAALRDGKSVRLLDADQQSSASLWAGVAEENGDPLPFEVEAANLYTVRKVAKDERGTNGTWVFIDCPPNGKVTDEAMLAADLVVIPTTTGPADMMKTIETAETCSANDKYYAILLTRVVPNTLTLKQSLLTLNEREASWFDTTIPQREVLKSFFGNSFGEDLYGYESVYQEAKEGLEDAD